MPRHSRRNRRNKRKSLKSKLLILSATLIALWYAGFSNFLSLVPKNGAIDKSANAVVVLTGGSDRVNQGVRLLVEKKADHLFISGVGQGVDITNMLIMSGDLPDGISNYIHKIDLGYEAQDTKGNAIEVLKWIQNKGYTDILLVTANYHMPRSLLEFNSLMPEVHITPFAITPYNIEISNIWSDSETRNVLISEYHKYTLGRLRMFKERVTSQIF